MCLRPYLFMKRWIIHERGQTKGRDGDKQGAQDYNICTDLKRKHLTLKDKTAKLSDSVGFKALWCHSMLPNAHQQPQERLMVQSRTIMIQAQTRWARCALFHIFIWKSKRAGGCTKRTGIRWDSTQTSNQSLESCALRADHSCKGGLAVYNPNSTISKLQHFIW